MLMYILLLFPCLCCLFWVVTLFCRWRRNPLPVKCGMIALLFIAAGLFMKVLFLTGQSYHYTLLVTEIFSILSFFSCIMLSVKTLTHEMPLSGKDLLLFLPGLLIGGTVCFLYFFIEEEKIPALMQDILYPYKHSKTSRGVVYMMIYYTYLYIYKTVMILMAGGALFYVWISLNRYKERLESFFSSLDGKSIKQAQALFYFLFPAVFFSFLLLQWEYLVETGYSSVIAIGLSLCGCALFYLGYHLSRLKFTAADFAHELELSDRQAIERELQHNALAYTKDQELWSRIRKKLFPVFNRLMDEEHLFLQPNLRLDDIAREANTNRNYISILLRLEHQCGFSEYINRRRIEYAKLTMRLNPELTQEQLSEKSGFNHTSSFSRAFKQYTGMTFREWQKKSDEW